MSFEKNMEVPTKEKTEGAKVENNVSANLAKEYSQVKEGLDAKISPNQKNEEARDLEADIRHYREQIKIAETKDENGRYNEKMVLENEAKLRQAEKELGAQRQKEEDAFEIQAEREKIKQYRENIKTGESKDEYGRYDEKIVLENEAKLKEAEKKINKLQGHKEAFPKNESSSRESKEISSERNEEEQYETYNEATSEIISQDSAPKEEKKSFWKSLFTALRK